MQRRDCVKVIDSMLAKIPTNKKELIEALNWNRNDAKYKAPEETLQWERTAETLNTHIPKPIADWEFEVVSIFTTKSIEELKRTYS